MDNRGTNPIRGAFKRDCIIGSGSFQFNGTGAPSSSNFRGSLAKLMSVLRTSQGVYAVSFSPALKFNSPINLVVSSGSADVTSTNRFGVALLGDVNATTGAFSLAVTQVAADQQYGSLQYQIQRPAADGAAGTDYTNNGPTTADGLTVTSVTFAPDANVTFNASNYKTLNLVYDNGAGGSATTVASLNTSASSWTANNLVTLAITASNAVIPAGSLLRVTAVHSGTGVALPTGTLTINGTNPQGSAPLFDPPNTAGNRVFFWFEGVNNSPNV